MVYKTCHVKTTSQSASDRDNEQRNHPLIQPPRCSRMTLQSTAGKQERPKGWRPVMTFMASRMPPQLHDEGQPAHRRHTGTKGERTAAAPSRAGAPRAESNEGPRAAALQGQEGHPCMTVKSHDGCSQFYNLESPREIAIMLGIC